MISVSNSYGDPWKMLRCCIENFKGGLSGCRLSRDMNTQPFFSDYCLDSHPTLAPFIEFVLQQWCPRNGLAVFWVRFTKRRFGAVWNPLSSPASQVFAASEHHQQSCSEPFLWFFTSIVRLDEYLPIYTTVSSQTKVSIYLPRIVKLAFDTML